MSARTAKGIADAVAHAKREVTHSARLAMVTDCRKSRYCLRRSIGQELEAVTFVRDYVLFYFEGPVLNAYMRPVVQAGIERC